MYFIKRKLKKLSVNFLFKTWDRISILQEIKPPNLPLDSWWRPGKWHCTVGKLMPGNNDTEDLHHCVTVIQVLEVNPWPSVLWSPFIEPCCLLESRWEPLFHEWCSSKTSKILLCGLIDCLVWSMTCPVHLIKGATLLGVNLNFAAG